MEENDELVKCDDELVKCDDETMSECKELICSTSEELHEERVQPKFIAEGASEFDNLSTEPKIAESQSTSKLPVLSTDETASKLNIYSNPNVSNTDDTIELPCEAVSLNTSEFSELGEEGTASKLNVTLDPKVNEEIEMEYDRTESMTFYEKHKTAYIELPRAHFKTRSESPKKSKSKKRAASPITGGKEKNRPPDLVIKHQSSEDDTTNSPLINKGVERLATASIPSEKHFYSSPRNVPKHYSLFKPVKNESPTVSSDSSSTLTPGSDSTLTPGSDSSDSVSGRSGFFKSLTKAKLREQPTESYESEVTATSKLPKEFAGSLSLIERSRSDLCDQSGRPKSSDQSETKIL